MSESVRESAKKPEATKKDTVSQVQTSEYSQSAKSSVDRILFLQRTIGNQAVGRLIRSRALNSAVRYQPSEVSKKDEFIQTKPLADQINPLVQRQVDDEEKKKEEEEGILHFA
jgi:hypothetical protein